MMWLLILHKSHRNSSDSQSRKLSDPISHSSCVTLIKKGLFNNYKHFRLVCFFFRFFHPSSISPVCSSDILFMYSLVLLPISRNKWRGKRWKFFLPFFCLCTHLNTWRHNSLSAESEWQTTTTLSEQGRSCLWLGRIHEIILSLFILLFFLCLSRKIVLKLNPLSSLQIHVCQHVNVMNFL